MLDIQKLVAEMGLKCITTCKLDALKSVRQINESDSQDAPRCGENASIQFSDSSKSHIENISGAGPGCANGELVCSSMPLML